MKFCFLCGKNTEELVEGYCEDCYNKEFNLIEVPEKMTFTVCKRCDRIKHRNNWEEIEVGELLRDKIKIMGKNVSIKINKNDVLHVIAKGYLKGSKKIKEKEEHVIALKPIKKVCIDCSRRSGGYFEAVIQLRGNTAEAMNFIDDQIIRENKTFRVEELKNGMDIYLADNNFADRVANELKKKFDAEVKKNYKLVTRKKGKDIYRSSILVRID
ncbi:MAG: 60S ribosomal export protein NMD3 [Candidatus Aenigmatarchaeota archaeon]